MLANYKILVNNGKIRASRDNHALSGASLRDFASSSAFIYLRDIFYGS